MATETDDLSACADLCEAHGFAAPAATLRALAEGTAPFYLVRALTITNDLEFYGFDRALVRPPSRRMFRDRAAAERHAQTLTIHALRHFRPDMTYGPPIGSTTADFVREVGAILGTAYEMPTAGGLLFPESATDEQLVRLAPLLYLTLFDVAEFTAGLIPPAR